MIGVACIGACQHGKTMLLSAISHVLPRLSMTLAPSPLDRQPPIPAAPGAVPLLNKAPSERLSGLTITPQQAHTYRFARRTFAHFDCPGLYTRNTSRCLALSDVAVLVVSAEDGPTHGTREHLAMAEAMGIEHLIVFLSKFDRLDDEERGADSFWFKMLDDELAGMMPARYKGSPCVVGSAYDAIQECLSGERTSTGHSAILSLIEHLCAVPAPLWNSHAPLRFWVQQTFSIYGQGTVAGGRLVAGSLEVGESVEFLKCSKEGPSAASFVTQEVRSLQVCHEAVEFIGAGHIAGVLLTQSNRDDLRPGTLLTSPGRARPEELARRVRMRLQLLPREQRQRHIKTGYTPQFQAGTMVADGRIHLSQETLLTGESAEVEVHFATPMVIPRHRKMLVCDHKQAIGVGHDIELVEASPPHWLWYQKESQETLVHLRDVLMGPPTQAMWHRLVDLYCGMAHTPVDTEEASHHRQVCSAYVLDHIRGWTSRLPAQHPAPPVGLWRRTSPACADDGSDGLGHFIEIRKRGRWFDFRDVFLTPKEDITSVMRQIMFAKVWTLEGPQASPWRTMFRCREEGAWVFCGELAFDQGRWFNLYSQLRMRAPGLVERHLSRGIDGPEEQATVQQFSWIALFEDGEDEEAGGS